MNSFSNTQQAIDKLPALVDVDFHDLHPDYAKVTLLSTLGVLAVILSAVTIFFLVTPRLSLDLPTLSLMAVLAITVSLTSYRAAKVRQFAVREHDILFRGGLFWQKTTAVSFNRIQHIDLTHGPLERKFGIASLKFFTAGGSSVDLKVPGLPGQVALKLRTLILDKAPEDQVIQDAENDPS